MKKSISYTGALLWNILPSSAKEQGITVNQWTFPLSDKILKKIETGKNITIA